MNQELVFNLVTAGIVYLFIVSVIQKDQWSPEKSPFTEEEVESYRSNGVLIDKSQIFSEQELADITDTLLRQVEQRAPGTPPEFSDNLNSAHLRNEKILDIARDGRVVRRAAQLLGVEDVAIFTTRILCKMPQTGAAIPWHQDSQYWPLHPMKVASFWLALDNTTALNGGMKMVNFTGLPSVRGKNLPVVQDQQDEGPNFFQHIPDHHIPPQVMFDLELRRGEASFHDAYIPHSSPPNLSGYRRCAWIVRYTPEGTQLIQGVRNDFHNHKLVKC